GTTGDLVELAGAEMAHALTVELGQGGDHHRADRHVDADAESVRPADDAEQPLLGQALHEPPVPRQHAGVVDTDPVAQQPRERLPEPPPEPEVADGLAAPVRSEE